MLYLTAIGVLVAIATLYLTFIRPKTQKAKIVELKELINQWSENFGFKSPDEIDLHDLHISERRIENFISGNTLQKMKMRFPRRVPQHLSNLVSEYSGRTLKDYWWDMKIAAAMFRDHYDDGRPEYGIGHIESRVELFNIYAN